MVRVRPLLAPYSLLLTAILSLPHVSSAQTNGGSEQQPVPASAISPPPSVKVGVTKSRSGETQLSLQISNSRVSDVISQIATRGNLEIVVGSGTDTVIGSLDVPKTPAASALQKVCQAANLRCENQSGVWIVSYSNTPVVESSKAPDITALEFKNTEAIKVLEAISREFKVEIAVGDVQGTIPYIRLAHKTPLQAVTLVAAAVGSNVRQTADGTLIVSK